VVGTKDVLDYLDSVADLWGYDVVSRVGIITPPLSGKKAQENDKKVDRAARAFFRALAEGRERRPALGSVIVFHAQRASLNSRTLPRRTTPTGRSGAGSTRPPATTRAPG